MKITSLYRTYYQKSRLFLYPNLGIRRGVSVTPTETYMQWKDIYSVKDRKLISVYHIRDDNDFKSFEKIKLVGNKLFDTFISIEDNKGAYIFDFSKYASDYDYIVNGKYSKLSNAVKVNIKNFFGNNSKHAAYIESFLFPHKFFSMYAELLNVRESELRKVGELCSLPDLEKETLVATPKILDFDFDVLNSPKK